MVAVCKGAQALVEEGFQITKIQLVGIQTNIGQISRTPGKWSGGKLVIGQIHRYQIEQEGDLVGNSTAQLVGVEQQRIHVIQILYGSRNSTRNAIATQVKVSKLGEITNARGQITRKVIT